MNALDERYFYWLYGQVASVKTRVKSRSYFKLLQQLYETEFVWLISNDDNRQRDGNDLRYEYLRGLIAKGQAPEFGFECSMLEMLLALSRRLGFELDEDPANWFWHLIQVMEVQRFNDATYDAHAAEEVENVVQRVIWRTYASDGQGGLFPLRHPAEDQRGVELWYQLNAYLLERYT